MGENAMVDNEEIAAAFEEVSVLLELTGDNPHRVRSYASVARTLAGLPRPASDMLADGTLTDVEGIGEGTAARVREMTTSGRLALLEDLRAKVPEGLFQVLKVPGLGPKRVREIWQDLGVTDLADLEYACLENRIRDLKGFGSKTQENVIRGIAFLKRAKGRRLISQGRTAAERVLNRLQREPSALRLAVIGSVRRMKPTVRDLNLLSTAHDAAALVEAFASMPFVAEVKAKDGAAAVVVLDDGTPVTLRVVPEPEFFAALVCGTGTPEHVEALKAAAAARGFRLDAQGLFRGEERLPLEVEEDVYRAIGLPFFPPETREGAALDRPPPDDLVHIRDVQGILHAHSTWSDGAFSVLEMARRAASSGFRWFAISDHSKTAVYANGLTVERVREQRKEVDALNASGEAGIPILRGTESDILPDGSLDYPDDVLAEHDVVIGSVHAAFRQPADVMTARLVKAVSNPYIHVLGHPTGRLLLGREGYSFDMRTVLDACAKHGTAIELNANPHRLDLDEAWLGEAAGRGVPIAIDPDAHSMNGIEDVIYGVGAARRGRLRRRDVLTCLSVDEFRAWCAKKRGKPAPPPWPIRAAATAEEGTDE